MCKVEWKLKNRKKKSVFLLAQWYDFAWILHISSIPCAFSPAKMNVSWNHLCNRKYNKIETEIRSHKTYFIRLLIRLYVNFEIAFSRFIGIYFFVVAHWRMRSKTLLCASAFAKPTKVNKSHFSINLMLSVFYRWRVHANCMLAK